MTVNGDAIDWGCNASQKIADAYTAAHTQTFGWQNVLAGIIGVYGFIKQAELLERQVDLQEDLVAHGERYLTLAERTFDEVTLDAYTCQKSLFERYKDDFDACMDFYVSESKRLTEYTPAYALQEGRAMTEVQGAFDKARLRRQRQRGKYNTGQCCYEETFFAVAFAQTTVDAANHGYRYEDDKKIRLDDWYWRRITTGAQIVENMRSHVISGVNGGVANVSGGLASIGGALGELRGAVEGEAAALRDRASFFGTVSNGAFRMAGFSQGYGQGYSTPGSSWSGGFGSSFGAGSGLGGQVNMGSSIGGGTGSLQSAFGGAGGGGILGASSNWGGGFSSDFGAGAAAQQNGIPGGVW